MPWTCASPRPVPFPVLVEKNGSKRRRCTAGDMPEPVSATESAAHSPGVIPATGGGSLSFSGRRESSIRSRPPPGIASRALRARLATTCSTWTGSTSATQSPGGSAVPMTTLSGMVRSSRLTVCRTRAASEVENLADQPGATTGLIGDGAELHARVVGERGVVAEQAGVGQHHRQGVVEVVRDAGGELPGGGEPRLLLGLLPACALGGHLPQQ